MKKYLTFILLALIVLINNQSYARNTYLSVGAGTIEAQKGVDILSPTNLNIKGGIDISHVLGIGVEFSQTLSSDQTNSYPNVDFDVDILTIFLRLKNTIDDKVTIYGQVGQGNVEVSGSSSGTPIDIDDSDTMFGVGLVYNLDNKKNYIDLNYSSYFQDSGAEVVGLSIAYGLCF